MSPVGAGSVLGGRYRVGRRIGKGAMGLVYEGERLEDGAKVALKLIRPELLAEPKARHRFQREARLGARISSDHVVRVLDSGVDEASGLPWLCFELVSGEPLDAWIASRGPLSAGAARAVIAQVFEAASAAHRAGVVHRDLKPENVLVTPTTDGALSVKVADFGVAKGLGDETFSSTEAGLGAPLWASPEQGKHGYVPSSHSDVWSLGLLVYWLLAGRHYWQHAGERGSLVDLALELHGADIVSASARAAEQGVSANLPKGFDVWFARCVAREPSARFGDAGAAWRGLAPLLAPGRGRWSSYAFALVLALAAAVAWLFARR